MKHYGDVSKINGAEVEPVDVITFGSPCQDLSVAGKRAGIQDGERSNLFFEAVRIIKEMRQATNGEYPKYAVWENVPGAFSSNKGHDFHAVLEALCSVCDDTVSIPKPYDPKRTKLVWSKAGEIVGDNYSVAWRTLDAQYWGVPQRRKRIYLVADFTGRCAGEILFKPESLRGDLPQGDEAGEGASADVVGGVDGSIRAVGIDGYNFALTGDKAATVGVNCGISTGRNGVIESVDGSVGECITTTTGSMMTISEELAPCIRARDYKDAPCVVYSFDSLSSNSMKSSNPLSGCRAVDVAKCIDTTYPDPSKNQGGVAVVQSAGFKELNSAAFGLAYGDEKAPTLAANKHDATAVIAFAQNQREEVRDLGDKAGALAAEAGVHQQTYVAQPVIALQANGIDRAYGIDHVITTGGNCTAQGDCVYEDTQATLKASGVHAVCYDARGNGDGETACTITGDHQNRITDYTAVTVQEAYTVQRSDEYRVCNVASTQSARQYKSATDLIVEKKRRYIIRRLTPTECARLQGFPDWWSKLTPYDPADAEFWEEVRKTHAEINGKKYKPCKNLKKWYDKLHTDSAEYKMWGNGIALPNARYVLQGIAEQGAKTLGSLFDGSGGFPLAGVLNGITPLWASEVEPYPIAVTKSRFKEAHNGK